MGDDILRDYECGLETNIPWKIPHYGDHKIITKKGNEDSIIWNIEYKKNNCNHTITQMPNVKANADIMDSYVMKRKNISKSIDNLHYPYIKFVNYILENSNSQRNNSNNGSQYNNDSIICSENDANLEFNRMLKTKLNYTMDSKEKKSNLSTSTKDKAGYTLQNKPNKISKLDNIKKYKRNHSSIVYYDFNTDNRNNMGNEARICNNNTSSNRTMANNNPLFPILHDRIEYRENSKEKNNAVESKQEEVELDLEQLLSCDTVDHLLSLDSSCSYKYDNNSYNSNGDLSYISSLLSPTIENNCNNNKNTTINNNKGNDYNLLELNNYKYGYY